MRRISFSGCPYCGGPEVYHSRRKTGGPCKSTLSTRTRQMSWLYAPSLPSVLLTCSRVPSPDEDEARPNPRQRGQVEAFGIATPLHSRFAMILSRGGTIKMAKMSGIVKMLTKERNRVKLQLSGLNAALSAFTGVYTGTKPTGKKRTISAAGRKRIAAAQRKRWAKLNAKKAA